MDHADATSIMGTRIQAHLEPIDFFTPSSPAQLEGKSPWNNTSLPPVRISTSLEVHAAVRSAREAGKKWSLFSLEERYAALRIAAQSVLANRAEGLDLLADELGKVPADSLFTELSGALHVLTEWKAVIAGAPAGRVGLNPVAFPHKKARIDLEARGVVGVIAPFNFPISGLQRSVYPALLLGNAVVVKPSEHSPRSSAWFLNELAKALPFGTLQVIQGPASVGRALIEAGIDSCVFTGSSEVGRLVEEQCATLGIVCSAEMGGSDAALVLAGADIGRTVAGITHWALQNAGQACASIEVVYVEESIAHRFIPRLAAAWKDLQFGTSIRPSGRLAPIALEKQRQKIEAHVEDAKQKGARVLVGGDTSQLKMKPTLLVDCTSDMDVVREETFGPVLAVIVVEQAEDAVQEINQSQYGLTASIWTKDIARAEHLISKIDVGVVTVNNHALSGAMTHLPWGGRRGSGNGIANSMWSLATFARTKTVVIDRSTSVEPYWTPFDSDLEALGNGLADLQLGNLRRAIEIPFLLAHRVKTVKRFFGMAG